MIDIATWKLNKKLFHVYLDLENSCFIFKGEDGSSKLLSLKPVYYSFDPYTSKVNPEFFYETMQNIKAKNKIAKEKKKKYKVYKVDRLNPVNYDEYIKNKATKIVSRYTSLLIYVNTAVLLLTNYQMVGLQEAKYIGIVENIIAGDLFYKKELPEIDAEKFYEEFKNTIMENDNIDEEAKKVLTDEELNAEYYKNLIFAYGKYMDKDYVLDRLKNVKIHYDYDEETVKYYAGMYIPLLNKIEMTWLEKDAVYDTDNMGILFHEFNHLTGRTGTPFGHSIKEAIAEQIKIKFFNQEVEVYKSERSCTALLENLVGHDALLRYYYQDNMPNLISSLTDIYGNSLDAAKLISLVDIINVTTNNEAKRVAAEQNDKVNEFTPTWQGNYDMYTSAVEEFLGLYRNYYFAKYGKDMDSDLMVNYYKNILIYGRDMNNVNYDLPGLDEIKPFVDIENVQTGYYTLREIFPQKFSLIANVKLAGNNWRCNMPVQYVYDNYSGNLTLDTSQEFSLNKVNEYWERFQEETGQIFMKGK